MNQKAITNSGFHSNFKWILLIFIGLSQTVFAYIFFSRADDHNFFLEIANRGESSISNESEMNLFKAKEVIAMSTFYILTTPSRLLGGGELTHLIWLRFVMLIGIISGANFFIKRICFGDSATVISRKKNWFCFLLLTYPGQIAWSASLLRDGAATGAFFLGLNCINKRFSAGFYFICLIVSLALRPELIVFLVLLLILFHFKAVKIGLKRPVMFTIIMSGLISVSAYPLKLENTEFSHLAFASSGKNYPFLNGPFDFVGYCNTLGQALIDPIPLEMLSIDGAFSLLEVVFFICLIIRVGYLLISARNEVVRLAQAALISMWLFAFFEIMVSGFSRHRLCVVSFLLMLVSCNIRIQNYRETTVKLSR